MATPAQVADTLKELREEMASRLDDLLADGDINESAATSLGGLMEGMASVEKAIRNLNKGKP